MAVLVSEDFFDTTHGEMDCRYCHGGVKFAETRAEAHEGMEPLPSSTYAESVCQPCHPEIADTFGSTLHAETRGVSDTDVAVVLERVGEQGDLEAVHEGLTTNCDTCHVSGCGDCHVTRPQFNDGGFVRGHVFYRSPNSSLNCMGCHGSRIEREFTGAGESDKCELTADLHWTAGMQCTACHTQEWMHGGDVYDRRYDAPEAPACEDCHDIDDEFLSNSMHDAHASPEADAHLQCQVCHAQDYNNCTACHVAVNEEGLPFYETESSYFDFNIGRNYDQSEDRPWDYIVVRHVPVHPDTFDFYADEALGDFAALPTFKYATPHSIKAVTRQTESGCGGCHDNDDLFLTPEDFADLPDIELEANVDVIVER